MLDPDEAPRRPKTAHTLGESLDRLSVRDLEDLKAALSAEIQRIESEIAKKGASRDAAHAVFKF
ncbi:hypothetical protein ATO13_15000 [Stappia sp. 22II-S9-Z10]|nr:hypothetical protein ATO13_15000 [Stappia sp. 22II-S9-Z10]